MDTGTEAREEEQSPVPKNNSKAALSPTAVAGRIGKSYATSANRDAGDLEAAHDLRHLSVEATPSPILADVRYTDIIKQFTILGWTAFGGTTTNIALFEKLLVDKGRWMTIAVFTELYTLAQCLPGSTSNQIAISMGVIKGGVKGGLLSGFLFGYPGSLIMTAVGFFAAKQLQHPTPALNGFISGVSAVGVAMVASTAKSLARKLCSQPLLACICTATAVIAYSSPQSYTFPCVIVGGGMTSLLWSFHTSVSLPSVEAAQDESVRSHGFGMPIGGFLIGFWLVVLVTSIVLVNGTLSNPPEILRWWEVFFRIGSIIFGGGPVVLPMMYNSMVQRTCDPRGLCTDRPDTWITSKQFYAGLGIVQAVPGPLFNFSTYLGTIMAVNAGYPFIFGAVLGWCAMVMPSIMILFGVLPFWGRFRRWGLYRRALPGFNAAGVGLIVTSIFSLTLGVLEQTSFPKTTLCVGILGFTAVDQLDLFQPLVVILGGLLGIAAWAAKMK